MQSSELSSEFPSSSVNIYLRISKVLITKAYISDPPGNHCSVAAKYWARSGNNITPHLEPWPRRRCWRPSSAARPRPPPRRGWSAGAGWWRCARTARPPPRPANTAPGVTRDQRQCARAETRPTTAPWPRGGGGGGASTAAGGDTGAWIWPWVSWWQRWNN